MATYLGKDGSIKVNTQGSAATIVVGEITSFAVSITVDTAEDSAFGDTWKTRKAGLKDWSATIDVQFDQADVGQVKLLEGAHLACEFTSYTGATFTGDAFVTGRSVTNSDPNGTSIVSQSFQLTGNGALVEV